jgi:hypothetical protein
MKRCSLLPIVTLAVFLIITGLAMILRGSLTAKDKPGIFNLQNEKTLQSSSYLDESEKLILASMLGAEESLGIQTDGEVEKSIYTKYLDILFCRTQVPLSKETANKVLEKINDIEKIAGTEDRRSLNKIALPGRGLIINLLEQIYDLCGIKLVHNLKGDVVEISDGHGDYMYTVSAKIGRKEFYGGEFIFILFTISILFSLCFIMAKKYHLFTRGEEYDEFNEKGFQ